MKTKIAQGDPLIVALGNNWVIRKVGNRLKRKYYTSSHMRTAARLRKKLRQLTDEKCASIDEFLRPCYFSEVAQAVY